VEGEGQGRPNRFSLSLTSTHLRVSIPNFSLLTPHPHLSSIASRRTLIVVRDFMAYFSNAVAASRAPKGAP
jgi:hypothetical protein